MQPTVNATVFIVDDDAIVREGMAWLLRSRRLMSESFDSADAIEDMLKTTNGQRHSAGCAHAGAKWSGLV
jgi:two-component system response regulator DctR